MGLIVYVCAALASARALAAWVLWDARLLPDTALYASGGLGLYPSPIGRLAGAFGETPLALVNAASAGVLVLVAALLARQLGGSAVLASVIALLTPLALWTMFSGVDALGAALVLASALLWLRSRHVVAGVVACLAVAAHLAIGPIVAVAALVLPASWRVRLAGLALLSLAGAAVLCFTPYGSVVGIVAHPERALMVAFLTLAVAALPYLPFCWRFAVRDVRLRLLLVAVAGTAIAAGVQGHERLSNGRYAVPLTFLASSLVAVPRGRGVQ